MGGKIELYEDCVSLYTYFALVYLERIRPQLKQYDIEVEFHPVFLGGIMAKSGNEPPWKFTPRAKYMTLDRKRAQKYFQTPDLKIPKGFPPNTLLPQRAATYMKANFEPARFEAAVTTLIKRLWEPPNLDISTPDGLREALAEIFSKSELDSILEGATSAEMKQKLLDTTEDALQKGAYGCPWFWVTDSKGKSEPFFGSDRFHFMWQFLEIPAQDMTILSPGDVKTSQKAKI